VANEKRRDPLLCPVCQREADNEFRAESLCSTHRSALENIRGHYKEWIRAYGSLSKAEYLHMLMENPNSGEWVTEIARYLLEKNETERL
jgi:hypothetical protein